MQMIKKRGPEAGHSYPEKSRKHASKLILIDVLVLIGVYVLALVLLPGGRKLTNLACLMQFFLGAVCLFTFRGITNMYRQVWRYGTSALYLRLASVDTAAGLVYYLINQCLPDPRMELAWALSIFSMNLLITLAGRLLYQYLYDFSSQDVPFADRLRKLTSWFTGIKIEPSEEKVLAKTKATALPGGRKINVAIVGAGRVGVMLAEELLNNPKASYQPCCFIDIDAEKIGRYIHGIRVLPEQEATPEKLASFPIQEIVFALPKMNAERKKELYEQYKKTGCKLKVYDYPVTQTVESGKRHLREFDIEELLFRRPLEFTERKTREYYHGKSVLISGGGGSIGGELCRQIAKMGPKKLIVLDVYENGAYDVQQELRIAYGAKLDMVVEIVSVCDREQLEAVFERNRPQVVLHAAAHKHVPLMERNCVEAVKNNVFGTLNIVEVSEKYGVEKFTMISTDKAVNPTNVMGATKRMCEMIVQSRKGTRTNFSATRFGNVLGSNGSVIPLFRRQIANGGPITLTDLRIIRYFMTIPEASQLVLTSGAMAKNGELYVLDMGKPIKILELAENMIRLSGLEPYKDIDIIETGLRPGEKLYEELLIKTEELDKTENSMIFIERDEPETEDIIRQKLAVLRMAVETGDDEEVRKALHTVVPTFKTPEEVNAEAAHADEMKHARNHAVAS